MLPLTMGLSSKREARLQAALTGVGFSVVSRTTRPMAYGDSVETTAWHLMDDAGFQVTLCLVTEVGLHGFFPPVLRAVRGHLAVEAAPDAPGLEHVWDEDAALGVFAASLRTL